MRIILCQHKEREDTMVISEEINVNGRQLIRHASDRGKIILQVETGREYVSAVDVIPCKYTYEETDKDIPEREEKKE